MSGTRPQPTRPRPGPSSWTGRAALPIPTLAVFVVLFLVLLLNAAVNHFRFNVALAALALIPVLALLGRGAVTARAKA